MIESHAEDLIRGLSLARHPEGGWYRETYRSNEIIPAEALPSRFNGPRSFGTSIYYLLERGEFSALHRISSDELWHFYAGAALTVYMLTPDGDCLEGRLGNNVIAGNSYQTTVPAGCWFGAEITGNGPFSLVGCTVSPGFDFADFEMGDRNVLLRSYPAHGEIIRRLTKMSET